MCELATALKATSTSSSTSAWASVTDFPWQRTLHAAERLRIPANNLAKLFDAAPVVCFSKKFFLHKKNHSGVAQPPPRLVWSVVTIHLLRLTQIAEQFAKLFLIWGVITAQISNLPYKIGYSGQAGALAATPGTEVYYVNS